MDKLTETFDELDRVLEKNRIDAQIQAEYYATPTSDIIDAEEISDFLVILKTIMKDNGATTEFSRQTFEYYFPAYDGQLNYDEPLEDYIFNDGTDEYLNRLNIFDHQHDERLSFDPSNRVLAQQVVNHFFKYIESDIIRNVDAVKYLTNHIDYNYYPNLSLVQSVIETIKDNPYLYYNRANLKMSKDDMIASDDIMPMTILDIYNLVHQKAIYSNFAEFDTKA